MPELDITVNGEAGLPAAASAIIDFAGDHKILLFNGPMGAGKTTLIKAICRHLGSVDNFSSPSFSIVNEYSSSRGRIYHFDLYRLRDATELLDIGIEEYIYSGNYCFFEWPALAEGFLDGHYVTITISPDGNIRYLRASK